MGTEQATGSKRAVAEMDYDAENTWIYQHRLRYRSYSDIAARAALPPHRDEAGRFLLDGGLGKTLARSTIHTRVKRIMEDAHEQVKELAASYRAASLDRLDDMAATAVGQVERMGPAIERARSIGAIDVHAEDRVTKAVMALLRIEERRAKLLGLDAPIEVSANVVHYDAEAMELAAILDAAAGKTKGKGKRKARA